MKEQVLNKILHCLQTQNYKEAEKICLFELSSQTEADALLLFHLGNAARLQGKIAPALVAFKAALTKEPMNVDLLQAAASCYEALGDYEKVYSHMELVVNLKPDDDFVIANMAIALEKLGRWQAALQKYDDALALNPLNLSANINRGTLLFKLGMKAQALEHNRKAYKTRPDDIALLFNLVDGLIQTFQYEEALAYCITGLERQPRHSHLLFKQGMVLSCLRQFKEAQVSLSKARVINPDVIYDFLPYLRNLPPQINVLIESKNLFLEAMYEAQRVCFWRDRAAYIAEFRMMIDDDKHLEHSLGGSENCFKLHSLEIDAERRLKLTKAVSSSVLKLSQLAVGKVFQYQTSLKKRIRIGYVSPDFRHHATAILARQIFGLHDRQYFEIYSYSLQNGEDGDFYTKDIEASSDVFLDASKMSSAQIAQRIFEDEIDILVDLAGYTAYSRAEIMASRPAPIQIQYLGFPATMGADFIDYAMIDKTFCPDSKTGEWYEQLIRLPHALYPYDNELDHSATSSKRSDYGLPDDDFVFCCLSSSYKIEPAIFDIWMHILTAVPNSVLWLMGKDSEVQGNLEREAEARNVDKSRLVFTGLLPLEQHIQRYQLADLFLDTYWVNAHTTSVEALWQGLPLITILGEVPTARGAASVLNALEMPELIVKDFDEYKRLAIFYAIHPIEYAAMREKLKAKRYTAPMYNTKLTVKHIEKAYQMAWEHYQAGLPPAAFDVPENTDPELRKSIH